MKKIILLFMLLVTSFSYSQDAFLTIGKLKLRYDADSNYLRIGYTNTFTGIAALKLGKELNGQLFNFNPSQFSWDASTGLNLSASIFSEDSLFSKMFTIFKDTTWDNLGEAISKNRLLNLKKDYWAISPYSNVPEWYFKYESRDVDNSVLSTSNYQLINDYFETDKTNNIPLSSADTKLDSLLLEPGTYSIDFHILYRFAASSLGDGQVLDTVEIGLNKGSGVGNILKNNIFTTYEYKEGQNDGREGLLGWQAKVILTSRTWIYLVGRSRSFTLGNTHTAYRHYMGALKIY